MSRFVTAVALGALALVLLATPAFAHVEFEPSSVEAGATAELTLFAENEQGVAITKLELAFPDDAEIIVADAPAPDGWTVTVNGGEVGSPASGITWEGSTTDDAELPLTLGPLPEDPQRLQFKAIVTYENGEEDEWLEDWPEGATEPETPGPVLDLTPVGGTVPPDEDTTVTTAADGRNDTTATTAADEQARASDDSDDDEGSNLAAVLIGAAVIVALGALGGFLYVRTRRT